MAAKTLLLLLLLVYSCVFANAERPKCPPSSCGIIPNISYPFRLKGDPTYCGHPEHELACESNVTTLYLNSHKFHVKAINYDNSTIRLADASVKNYTCSFPTYSAYLYNFSTSRSPYPYVIYEDQHATTLNVNLMTCPQPLNTSVSPPFIDVSHCQSSVSRFSYIKIGRMKASEVARTCRVDMILMTSWEFKDFNNVSIEEIHRSLLYGFELDFCTSCTSSMTAWDKFIYIIATRLINPFQILLVIVGAAANPIMSIIGFAIISLLLLFFSQSLHDAIQFGMPDIMCYALMGSSRYDHFSFGVLIFGIFGARIIISLFLARFFIYKFRRRHLSRYDTIERFLQSDNKLVSIRYSYSDIRKMTKNFQYKLGEGGYGSVYKGKLRSGHYVAVKLLGKSTANDKDFMNEIATIGRIHHVNIVTLVGYCVEGSKRALVLDFMANGSFEKYIFDKEKMNSFSWEIKFEIVTGVARGIEYLRRGCNIRILHFDIKPHNILLDDKFIPKVSDFGLAKFFSTDINTLTLTAARGTIGYVAPELINRGIGRVSYKADVYSYGMLLMETLGLKRDLEGSNDDSSKYFPFWIYDSFNQGIDMKIERVDENDISEGTRILVRKMTIVALWCTQMNPDDRPSMNEVLKMLEGEVEHLQIPHYPSVSHCLPNEDETWGTSSTYSGCVSMLHYKDASNVEITIDN